MTQPIDPMKPFPDQGRPHSDGVTIPSDEGLKTLMEVIAAPGATNTSQKFIFVLANTDASGYNGLTCHIEVGAHWTFKAHTIASITASVNVPSTATVTAFNEIIAGQRVPVGQPKYDFRNSTFSMSEVELGTTTLVVRIFEAILEY